MSGSFSVGGHSIGEPGDPCFVIAEAGVNHNGEAELAHQLIAAAADVGADCVKFQTFSPELVASATAESAAYQRERGATDQRTLLEGLTLPAGAWTELEADARERGLVFMSTPFDLASAEFLAGIGVPALKVPSGELDNLPFIRGLAAMGLPMIISTGMGTLAEVEDALGAASGARGVAIMHCVSAYPAPTAEANLRAIATLRERTGLPVGWSDHTEGYLTAIGAIALGASLLEKHLTLDRSMPGPDHGASEDPAGFAEYVEQVRAMEAALGDGEKRPAPSEKENRLLVRRSWHATRRLGAGEEIGSSDVVALRPAGGLPPGTDVVGSRTAREIAAGDPIRAEDLA